MRPTGRRHGRLPAGGAESPSSTAGHVEGPGRAGGGARLALGRAADGRGGRERGPGSPSEIGRFEDPTKGEEHV